MAITLKLLKLSDWLWSRSIPNQKTHFFQDINNFFENLEIELTGQAEELR